VVTPNTARQGQTVSITVTGQSTHFDQATTQLNLGANVTITSLTVASPTSLTAQVSVGNDAVLGARTLTASSTAEVVTRYSPTSLRGSRR
jgi:hypothetical protein